MENINKNAVHHYDPSKIHSQLLANKIKYLKFSNEEII